MKELSIVIPAYNEARSIGENLRRLDAEVASHVPSYEIILVSDGSTDGTHEEAQRVGLPSLRVLHYTPNRGKGHALRYGCARATGDLVLFIDGGMEIHPHDIRIFLGLLELYDADAVIGSKRHPQSRVEYPLLRRFLSRVFQKFVRLTLGLNVRDTQVGLKLFRREVLDAVLPLLLVKRYAFDVELLAVAHRYGYRRIIEAPIQIDWTSMNAGRRGIWELARIARMGWNLLWDTMAIIYRTRIRRHYDAPRRTMHGVVEPRSA